MQTNGLNQTVRLPAFSQKTTHNQEVLVCCCRRRFLILAVLFVYLVASLSCWTQRRLLKLTDRVSASTKYQLKRKHAMVTPLLELSRQFRPPPSNITAALCLRTVYRGRNDGIMEYVLRWVAYHRLLGFDEILVWYVKDLTPPGIELLETLPYVTLVENTRHPFMDPNTTRPKKNHPGGQKGDIAECLKLTENRFDWVFLPDADEYLYFAEMVRLKDFLLMHKDKKYLSFGKWMYDNRLQFAGAKNDLIGLEKYPYTYKSYCFPDGRDKQCPGWQGRSKVLFRRDSFDDMPVHGIERYISKEDPCVSDRCHFNTDVAHLKEWKSGFGLGKKSPFHFLGSMNLTVRSNESSIEGFTFLGEMNETLSNETRLVGNFQGIGRFEMNAEGKNILYRDDNLQDWFDFLAREPNSKNS